MKANVIRTKSLRGEADIRPVGKNWQVRLNGETYEFSKLDVPKSIQAGRWWVSMSGKGDKVYNIGPVDGVFPVRYAHMGGKPGETPKPMYDAGGPKKYGDREWVADPSLSFIAVLEIVSGKCKGMETNVFLPYLYVRDNDNPRVCMHQGTAGQVEKIQAFEAAAGLEDDLTYSDNVLPALHDALLKAAQVFDVLVEGGKVTKVLPKDKQPNGSKSKVAAAEVKRARPKR